MWRLWRLLVLAALLGWTCSAHANSLRLDGRSEQLALDGCASVLIDTEGKLELQDILAQPQTHPFTPPEKTGVLHLGLSHDTFWLKCDLEVVGDITKKGYLEIGQPYLDKLDVYFVRAGNIIASYQTGDHQPASSRPVAYHNYAFPVPDGHDDLLSLYIRVQSTGPVTVPISWSAEKAFHLGIAIDLAVLSAYWGVLIALSCYNFFLFLAVRAWSYLHYVVTTIAFGLSLSVSLGYGAVYLWPTHPGYNDAMPALALAIAGFSGVYLTCSFFSTAKLLPKAHRWFMGIARLYALTALVSVAWPEAAILLINVAGWLFVLTVTNTVIHSMREKFAGALPFGIAIALQVTVNVSQLLQSIGTFSGVWSLHTVQAGSASVAMLFALSMAVRLQAIKLAKERAQAEAISAQTALVESLRENERELERRVDERTADLATANASLQEREQQLLDLAHHDALTGAATRRLFEDRLNLAITRSARQKSSVAVIAIDLDGFKAVNDTYGHAAGDEVLIALAKRFKNCIRSADTLGRPGGDEFLIVLEDITLPESAIAIASKILRETQLPIAYGEHTLQVSASLGLALCPEHADNPGELLRLADSAMYEAKHAGKNTLRLAHAAGSQS